MRKYILICLFLSLSLSSYAQETTVVKVGGYSFPPFVDLSTNTATGVTIDLIRELNLFQKKYRFEFFQTSPKRRYHDFEKGNYDLIFFENLLWGWEEKSIDASKIFLTGGEVYIAKALEGRDQSYFNSLVGKSKAGILGYHYGFANFNAAQKILSQRYQMKLYTDHRSLIDKVILGQSDIAVVTASYLSYHLKQNPSHAPKLLISKKYDQKYKHTVLIRRDKKPGVAEINRLLGEMKKSGVLDRIWRKYGISPLKNLSRSQASLVIGVSFAIPPYVIKDTDQGIELDILRNAFSVTARTIQIKYLPLARTFTELKAGNLDGAINIRPGMIEGVFYSDEVITFHNCAISLEKKGYPDFKDLSFLKNKYVIAFQRAPTILGKDFAEVTVNNDKYEEVADQRNQIFRLFLDRNADFIVMEKQIFNYYRKKAIKDQTIGQKAELPVRFHMLFQPTRYRFAFKEKMVRDDFNHGLSTIRTNKTYSQIIQKYEKLMSLD